VSAASTVSVVIPTHDRAFCVRDAIASVLAQTHPEVECVVVDDGSTDDTAAMLRAAFHTEPRVSVVEQPHAGVSAARNRGLHEAHGDFVTFLDSDDLMPPERVRWQLDALGADDVDAVIGRQRQELVGDASFPDWFAAHPEWWDGFCHITICVPLDLARSVGGFDQRLEVGEDIDWVVRLAGTGAHIAQLDRVLVVRRIFGDNLTYRIGPEGPRAMWDAVRGHMSRRRTAEA
jgi:glycosyltransferase involved in cell wall biosynthesis